MVRETTTKVDEAEDAPSDTTTTLKVGMKTKKKQKRKKGRDASSSWSQNEVLPIVIVEGFDTRLSAAHLQRNLLEHFGQCGRVTRMTIPKSSATNSFDGYAFINFNDIQAACNALDLNGFSMGGFSLKVDYATPVSLPEKKDDDDFEE